MVKAIIDIDERTNRVINIVKAKHGLSNKSQAIQLMASEYEGEILTPQLRPEYIEKIKKIENDGSRKVGTVDEFQERYGIKHDV